MKAVTTDTGPFAIIPEWLLYTDITSNAIRLFAVLARYADWDSKTAYPGRKVLAEHMRSSLSTVDRAISELEAIGALDVDHRIGPEGDPTSNLYHLHFVNRGSRTGDDTGSPTGEEGGSRTGDDLTRTSRNENQPERESSSTKKVLRPRKRELEESEILRLEAEFPEHRVRDAALDYLNWKGSANHADKVLGLRNMLKDPSREARFRKVRRTPGQPTASLGSTLEQRKAAYGESSRVLR